MARTASMKTADAEAMIGPADRLVVTTENRPLLRKWVVSLGLPSGTAYAMSNVELANMYAERASFRSAPAGEAPTYYGKPAPIRADVPVPTNSDAADQLAAALKLLIGNPTAVLNEERVRQIAAEEAAKIELPAPVVAVTRLEISSPTGLRMIEGVVHATAPLVIRVAALGHHIMLVGPAGCGKTAIGAQVAQALGFNLYITSTVFDTHELLGFNDGMGNYHTTAFRTAFQNGGVWIADEVDAWDAAALLAANSALANGYATFPDSPTPVIRHPDFRMIATANTYGHGADRVYVGRNELDAASLDRFATIDVDYDAGIETAVCNGNVAWMDRVIEIRNIVRNKNIRHVVSTRAIQKGSEALAAGIDQTTVEALYVFKGMSKSDREKIRL